MPTILYKDGSIVGCNLTNVSSKSHEATLDMGKGPEQVKLTVFILTLSVNAKHVPDSAYFSESPIGEHGKFSLHIAQTSEGKFISGKLPGIYGSDPMTEADMDDILERSGFNASEGKGPYTGLLSVKVSYYSGGGKRDPKNYFKGLVSGDAGESLMGALKARKPSDKPAEVSAAATLASNRKGK